jgi:OLD-like protein
METSTNLNLVSPADERPRAVVLVEGRSDRMALEVLARRRGRDLEREGVRVVAMGGATNVGHYLDRYGPRGLGVKVAGLYDSAEERFFAQGLARAGLGAELSRAELQDRGFFVCTADLEDELIRAIGAQQVEQLVEAQGEIASFRRLQRQPALRERSLHDQLRRLMSGRSGGKLRYAGIMAEAVDLHLVPRPLDAVLDYV